MDGQTVVDASLHSLPEKSSEPKKMNLRERIQIRRKPSILASVLILCVGLWPVCGQAEEQYQRFLQKLRDEQLFDLALVYLDELTQQTGVSESFKEDIELERGTLLYQSAALLAANSPARVEKLDAAEAALRLFLAEKKDHPRRSDARTRLGELLLTRAEESKSTFSGEAGAEIPEAIKFYEEAHLLFEAAVQELAEQLKQLEGNRVDPNDSAKVAYRQKLRQEIRHAQLLSAKAVEERGRSRAEQSPQRRQDLEQAVAQFSDLYSKEQRLVGIRNYALFYRSGIHASLDKQDDAVDGYQRIVDLEGVDELRPLQANALTELLKLLAAQGKHPLAVDRAGKWLAGLRPDERRSAETIALQLELARVSLAWAKLLREKDAGDRTADRLVRDARSDLRSLLRTAGPHLDATRELLAELGVEPTPQNSSEVPQVKDFSEALAEAQKRLDQADTDSINVAVLEGKLAEPDLDPQEKAAVTQQLQSLRELVATTREQSLQLLRQGLRLFDKDDERSQLFEARFRIAFLLLRLDRPWDAMVVGDFLARTNPGSEQGLRAAAVTLASFSALLDQAGGDKSSITDQLEPFAEYLVASWPQSTEAAAAAAALAQLAIINKDWDRAETYLQMVPASTGNLSKRRDLGVSLYIEYLREKRDAGQENEATKSLRERATKWLAASLAELKPEDIDAATVDAINAQARLLMASERTQEAAELLTTGPLALVQVLENKPDIVAPKAAMDTYRTAIQLSAAQLVDGSIENDAAVSQMQALVARLQQLAKTAEDGENVLSGIFLALARDLTDKLAETPDAARKNRLSDAVLLVIGEAAKSDSFNTQYWAGNTKIEIAKELAKDPPNRQVADKAFAEGAAILENILAKEQSQPGWIQPEAAKTQIQISLARAQAGMKNYQAAVLRLGEVLDENNALLDVQIEAAEVLQAWGADQPAWYRAAIMGGRRKAGKNVIWGWGKIAQMTTNQPNFTDQFYNARYQLAKSRFRYALSLADAKQKSDEVKRAEKDILSTASLYPALGGEAKKKEYDALFARFKRNLGNPVLDWQS